MKLQKMTLPLLLVAGMLGSIWAGSAVAMGAATSYTVEPGDTFSTIAARHYGDAGVWRAVWKANPQVESPSALAVGTVLTLPDSGSLDIPRSYRDRDGMKVVKLSPKVISVPLEAEVYSIPRDAIAPFIRRPRVFNRDTARRSPYVIGQKGGRLTGGPGDKVYVRGLPHDRVTRFGIYREGGAYRDIPPSVLNQWGSNSLLGSEYSTAWGPGTVSEAQIANVLGHQGYREGLAYLPNPAPGTLFDNILGYEAVLVGVAELEKFEAEGFSTMAVTEAHQEILNGDVVLPLQGGAISLDFEPHFLDHKVYARVIKVPLEYTQAGQLDLVYLNVGAVHGVKAGAIFNAYQIPNTSFDLRQNRNVILPRERVGLLMVIRTYERLSFAIVLEAAQPIRIADQVESADST